MQLRQLILWLPALLAICGSSAFGQQAKPILVTADLDSATIDQFVTLVEKQAPVHFFYDNSAFDTLAISLHVKDQPLTQTLDGIFVNTAFRYSISASNHVFLASGKTLIVSLPPGFDKNEFPDKTRRTNAYVDTLDDYEDLKPEQKAALENKLYEIGSRNAPRSPNNVILDGYIKDAATGEPVVGASVIFEKTKLGITTDQYGYYSISLPPGRNVMTIQSIGMKDARRQLMIYTEGKLNVDMQSQVLTLKRVVISAQKLSNVKGTQMGLQKVDIKTIKQVPVVFGEADVLRVLTTLPGVKTAGEASTGLNVRGGSTDQNLILFNDATIYNPAHFFGMFSAFNPEVVRDVELYKSSIPARYGGRLSSVLNINSREGSKKNLNGSAGIGLLTSRINLEGPLIKDKSSFILGARGTYANWLLNALPDQYKKSKASFYDFNLSVSHEFNKKNTIYLTGYFSKDRFNLNSDTVYGYGNTNASVKWKHIFSNKMNSQITVGYDRYQYNISSERLPPSSYKMGFDINQTYLKAHFNYYLTTKHTMEYGFNSMYYLLNGGSYRPAGKESLVVADEIEPERALESALYLSDRYSVTSKLSVDAGIRYSVFNYLGPKTVNQYAPGLAKTESNMLGSISYGSGKMIKTYSGPEYRLAIRYAFTDSFSIKAGFNTQRQYIHMLSNTTAMAPTDVWKLSDPNIKPQYGDQVSLGIYKNLKANTIEVSAEVYYKNIRDYLDFKSGAVLVMNHHVETDVIGTKGKAYGVELLIKKLTGKLNGWIGYTWSRIHLKVDDPTTGEIINKGLYYPASYDKPHDITFIGNYRVSHRFSLSLNATYSTGRPITLPVGRFYYAGSARTIYADRNAHRIPDYFRSDFSMNIDGNHKVHQKTHNSWTIGVYNLTARKNPYSVYYVSEGGTINGYKLSIFGSAIPYVNFNIRF